MLDPRESETPLKLLPVTGSIAMSFLRAVADYTRQHGLDAALLFEDCGIPSAWLDQPSRRIAGTVVNRLFIETSRRLDDPLFGLHLGQSTKPWHYDVLGYLLMSSDTLGGALHQLLKYEPIVGNVGRTQLQWQDDTVLLVWTTLDGRPPPRHLAEENLSSWLSFTRWLSQSSCAPRAVYFQHPAGGKPEDYERLFNCRVFFNQPRTAFQFDRSLLELPLSSPDPKLRRVLEARADSQLAQLPQGHQHTFTDAVKHHLTAMLRDSEPSLKELTKRLNVSARTLQRRLCAEGYSYKIILDEVRRGLALHYIDCPGLSLHTISALLGFSDQSAFQRAFKRWTGSSPGQYRNQ